MDLNKKIADAPGVYKRFAPLLSKIGIIKFSDFLYHYPFRYDNFSYISKISKIHEGETVTIQGKVLQIKNIYTKSYKKIQKALIEDETGQIEVIWFNQMYLTRAINSQDEISLSGKIERNNLGQLVLTSPEYEIINNNSQTIHTGRIVPVYPETRGISSKWMRKQVKILLDSGINLFEYIPSSILSENHLIPIKNAIESVHFPESMDEIAKARHRLKFDELLTIQSQALIRKNEWKKSKISKKIIYNKYEKEIASLIKSLPYELTNAQKSALDEIFADMKQDSAMNRLLEGDVGSGKTVVAAISMFLAHLNGLQATLIAPTQILAEQHFKTISKILEPFKVKISLITGGSKKQPEPFNILIGTHAILSDKIKFENLGLIVIDEQQHFGVEQRAILREKGGNPHLLTMTATPIPRTVALTLYGDLSLTILDEMPKNRKTIKTWLVPPLKRNNAYEWIEKEIKENKSQAFIICPFIEESETMTTVRAASKEYEKLQKIFSDLKVGLLHGKMKSKEKEAVLEEFKNNEINILVATPIVEVGIDFPNATIIVIEASERFGLAQLHQLRGRVGRGEKQSYCLLFSESSNPATLNKLKSLETINVGATLAELDLKIRGAGDIYGIRQHGLSELKIADFSDHALIETTRKTAEMLVKNINKYPLFLTKIKSNDDSKVSPD